MGYIFIFYIYLHIIYKYPFWLKLFWLKGGALLPRFPPDAWSQKRSRRLFEHGSRFCASPAPLRLSSPLLRGVAGSLCRQSSFLLELPALPAQPAAPEHFAPGPRRIPAIPRPPRAPLADLATQCTMGMPRLAPLPSAPLLRLHVPMLPAQSVAHMPGAVAEATVLFSLVPFLLPSPDPWYRFPPVRSTVLRFLTTRRWRRHFGPHLLRRCRWRFPCSRWLGWPLRGRRVGEAGYPGPPSDTPTCWLPAPVPSDPPIWPTCLDLIYSSDSTRRRIAFWPGY